MSFQLSPGTLDELAGVYAPSPDRRSGSGNGKAGRTSSGGALAISLLARSGVTSSASRPDARAKQAFQASTHVAATRSVISTLDRTARGSPEVVVRITGRQHGAGHVLANFSYISRLGRGPDETLALHTSDEEVLRDGRDMQELARDWQEWEVGDDTRRAGATSISMILSMPVGTDPERLREAALAFAREEFANRSWVASLHVDRDHPHVHLTFARRDLDGRRFHPNRDDLFRYRQRFARNLRDRGIDANATPTRARGIDPTHEPIAVRKVREKGEVPRLDRSRAERARRLREQGLADPAQAVLAERQAMVRAAYERSIAELQAMPSIVSQTVAQSTRKFLAAMPAPEANSLKAARRLAVDRDVGARSMSSTAREETAPIDPVQALLAHTRAVRDRLEARRARDREVLDPATSRTRAPIPRPTPPAAVQPEPKTVAPSSERQPETCPPDRIDEILRQVHERERARLLRDRDLERDRDRGGPSR